MYRPYDQPQHENELVELAQRGKTILAEDYNTHSTLWNCRAGNQYGHQLERFRFVEEQGMSVRYVEKHTRIPQRQGDYTSTIDLVLTKEVGIRNIQTLNTTSLDHNPICFEPTKQLVFEHTTTARKDYSKTDWTRYSEHINRNLRMRRSQQNLFSTITEVTKIIP